MAKPTTKTEVVTKAFARSGPEIRPDQIRLADEAQTDKSKVFTQTDVNQGMSGGGGGTDPSLPYALVVGETDGHTVPKSASDGVEATQILETITLQDASGNSLGDIHFESGYGIGVALSPRHANTIYIQGSKLQNGVEANAEKIAELEAQVIDIPEGGESYDDTAIKEELSDLQTAFDTAVLAAQGGAENLEIELQSYAKKEDIPPSPDLTEYAKKEDIPPSPDLTEYVKKEDIADRADKDHTHPATDLSGVVAGLSGTGMGLWIGSQAEYDALSNKRTNNLYVVV